MPRSRRSQSSGTARDPGEGWGPPQPIRLPPGARPPAAYELALGRPKMAGSESQAPPPSRRSPSPLVARGPRLISKRRKAAAEIWGFPGNVDRNFRINQDNPHTQKSVHSEV